MLTESFRLPTLFGKFTLLAALREIETIAKVDAFLPFITANFGALSLAETTVELPNDKYLALVLDQIIKQIIPVRSHS